MPTRQPSCASFLTSAAPSPGPTPATIATRSCRMLVILCSLFGFTVLLSRATRRREHQQVSVAQTEYPKLLREFTRRLGSAFWQLAAWQPPRALFGKRQNEELSKRELVFLAIRSDADGHGVLRHITTQCAVELVPPAKNRAPV